LITFREKEFWVPFAPETVRDTGEGDIEGQYQEPLVLQIENIGDVVDPKKRPLDPVSRKAQALDPPSVKVESR
jgi:hypothetical protein